MFDEVGLLLLFHSIISIVIDVFITCSVHYMLFPVRALSVSTLPSVAITRPLQSCYMSFPLHAHSIPLALPA